VGYKAFYSDGKLAPERQGASSEPKICAGNTGTRIIVKCEKLKKKKKKNG
jgi:hypothetical protein